MFGFLAGLMCGGFLGIMSGGFLGVLLMCIFIVGKRGE